MFRDSGNSVPNDGHFGVGSVVKGMGSESWLVVISEGQNVKLLDMCTLSLTVGTPLTVADINHFTLPEVRALVDFTKKNYTFSDFTFNSKNVFCK